MGIEDVGIAATAGRAIGRLPAGAPQPGRRQAHHRRLPLVAVARIGAAAGDLDPGADLGRARLEPLSHVPHLRRQLRLVPAARLRLDGDLLRHDVRRRPAADHPDVRRRLRVDPAQAHRRNPSARRQDRAHALLRHKARVRRLALHPHLEDVVRWCGGNDCAGWPGSIQNKAQRPPHRRQVHLLRAGQAHLFFHAQHDPQRPMRQVPLLDLMRGLQDRRHRALVVCPEDRAPVGSEDPVRFVHREPSRWRDGIQMPREKDRLSRPAQPSRRDQVPHRVPARLKSRTFQRGRAIIAHRPLLSGRAIERRQV